jgi:hypothetical protein
MHSTPWTLYRDSFAVVMTRFPLLLSHNNVLSRATEPIGLEPSTTGSISQGHLQSDTESSSHPLVIHPSRILHRGSIQKRRNGRNPALEIWFDQSTSRGRKKKTKPFKLILPTSTTYLPESILTSHPPNQESNHQAKGPHLERIL